MALTNVDSLTTEPTQRGSVSDVVRSLNDVFGQQLTAIVAGVDDPKLIGAWASGEQQPTPEAERRMRDAQRVVDLLLEVDAPEVVRAWFVGLNPELNDRVPALVIADEPEEVMLAAGTFLAHG